MPDDVRASVIATLTEAFNNRAGRVVNVSAVPNALVFEGDEKDYGCLDLGMLSLRGNTVLNNIEAMRWVDEDPDECCDMISLFSKYAR